MSMAVLSYDITEARLRTARSYLAQIPNETQAAFVEDHLAWCLLDREGKAPISGSYRGLSVEAAVVLRETLEGLLYGRSYHRTSAR